MIKYPVIPISQITVPECGWSGLSGRTMRCKPVLSLLIGIAMVFSIPCSVFADWENSDDDVPPLVLVDRQAQSGTRQQTSQSVFEAGLGAGFLMIPEEADYVADSVPWTATLYWDVEGQGMVRLQAGYSMAEASLKYEAYKTDWENKLTTQVVYLAYVIRHPMEPIGKIYALAGLAYFITDLKVIREDEDGRSEISSDQDAGFGFVAGGGYQRLLESIALGVEFNTFSHRATFYDDIENAVGYNQLLLFARYRF